MKQLDNPTCGFPNLNAAFIEQFFKKIQIESPELFQTNSIVPVSPLNNRATCQGGRVKFQRSHSGTNLRLWGWRKAPLHPISVLSNCETHMWHPHAWSPGKANYIGSAGLCSTSWMGANDLWRHTREGVSPFLIMGRCYNSWGKSAGAAPLLIWKTPPGHMEGWGVRPLWFQGLYLCQLQVGVVGWCDRIKVV